MITKTESYLTHNQPPTDYPELQHYLEVFRQLPQEERNRLDRAIRDLTVVVPKMGIMSAFELVAKIGVLLAKPGGNPLPPAS